MTDNAIVRQDRQSIEVIQNKYMGLLREMIVNGRKLTDDQIRGRAAFAAQQGLDPVSEVNTLVDKDGKTLAHSMHINGYRRKCLEQEREDCPGGNIDLEFVPMPKESLPQGAYIGYECRMRDDASYIGWQKRVTQLGKTLREAMGGSVSFQEIMQAAGPAPVYTGVGIVYQEELSPWKDKNFNPLERAKKRAESNARKRRFPTNAPMIEAENGTGGIVCVDGEISDVLPDEGVKHLEPETRPVEQMISELYGDDVDGYHPNTREAEQTPRPPEPEPKPEPKPTAARTPAMLVAVIRDEAKKWEGNRLSAGKRGLVVSCLEACFDVDQESRRKDVQKYLTGKLSTKDIPDNELIAIYQWLQPSQDTGGAWSASPQAQTEARNIYAETLRAGGAQANLI